MADEKFTPGVIPDSPLIGGVMSPLDFHSPITPSIPDTPSQVSTGALHPEDDFLKIGKQMEQDGIQQARTISDGLPYLKDQFKYAVPYAVNQTDFERYYNHDLFKKLSYSPWRDNDALYNSQSSWWQDFKRASGQMFHIAGKEFTSALTSWGDLFHASTPNVQDQLDLTKAMQIGTSSKGGFGSGVTNTWLNFGITAGIAAEAASEELLLLGATALTAGADSEITLPAMGARGVAAIERMKEGMRLMNAIGKAGKYAPGAVDITKAATRTGEILDDLQDVNKAKNFWDKAKGFGTSAAKFLNPLENTTDALMNINKTKDVGTLAKNAYLFGAFYRDVRTARLVANEARLEGGQAYLNTFDQLTNDFYAKNGRMPDSEEYSKIHDTAMKAGTTDTLWNLPGIYLTDKLVFDNIFRPFTPTKFLSEEFATKTGAKVAFDKAATAPFQVVKSGAKSAAKALIKPRTYWKAGLQYFKGNLAEGIQENVQDIIQNASQQYYTNLYNHPLQNSYQDVVGSILDATKQEFGSQGLQSFVGGFAMGFLMKPFDFIGRVGREKFDRIISGKQTYDQYQKLKNDYETKTIDNLNELYKDPIKFFGPGIVNVGTQGGAITGMNKAQQAGDSKVWQDHKDASTYNHILTALETGTGNIFLQKLDSIASMDAKTAGEAFGVENGQEIIDSVPKMKKRFQAIKDNFDKWNNLAPNPFDRTKFSPDSPEWTDEALSESAWNQSRNLAVFMSHSFQRSLERQQGVLRDLSENRPASKINASDITLLSNQSDIYREVNLLKDEISSMKDVNDPILKRSLSQKKAKLEKLTDFSEALNRYKILSNTKEALKDAKITGEVTQDDLDNLEKERLGSEFDLRKSYGKYVKALADVYQEPVLDENVNSSFSKLKDFHDLNTDSHNLSEVVNLLSNPEGFRENFNRTSQVLRSIYDQKRDILTKGVKDDVEKKEINAMLNTLYDKGITMAAPDLDKFLEDGTIPQEFFDTANKIAIRSGSPKFEEARQILEVHNATTKPVESKAEEIKASGVTTEKPTEEKQVSAADEWEQLPSNLRRELEPLWDRYFQENKDAIPSEEIDYARQRWLQSPTANRAISKYNLEYKLATSKAKVTEEIPVLRTRPKLPGGGTLGQMSIPFMESLLQEMKDMQENSPQGDPTTDARELDIKDLEQYISRRKSSLAPEILQEPPVSRQELSVLKDVIFARHAQTWKDVADILSGQRGEGLDEEGKEQARKLGDRLREQEVGLIIYSPSTRNDQTSEIASAISGAVRRLLPSTDTWDIKDFVNKSDKEFNEKYWVDHPDALEFDDTYLQDHPEMQGLKLGETFNQFKNRSLKALAEISEVVSNWNKQDHEGPSKVAVIAHSKMLKVWDAIMKSGMWDEEAAKFYLSEKEMRNAGEDRVLEHLAKYLSQEESKPEDIVKPDIKSRVDAIKNLDDFQRVRKELLTEYASGQIENPEEVARFLEQKKEEISEKPSAESLKRNQFVTLDNNPSQVYQVYSKTKDSVKLKVNPKDKDETPIVIPNLEVASRVKPTTKQMIEGAKKVEIPTEKKEMFNEGVKASDEALSSPDEILKDNDELQKKSLGDTKNDLLNNLDCE